MPRPRTFGWTHDSSARFATSPSRWTHAYPMISPPRSAIHLSCRERGLVHRPPIAKKLVAREPDGVVLAEVGAIPRSKHHGDA